VPLNPAISQGLTALLQGAIDYAGLFPPASLTPAQSAAIYAQNQASSERWLLSKMAVTPAHLPQIWDFWKKSGKGVLNLAIIGRSSENADEFVEILQQDVHAINKVLAEAGDAIHVKAWELKLPESVTHRMPSYATYDLLNRFADIAEKQTPGLEEMYFEPSLRGDWKNTIPSVLDSIFRTRVTRQKDAILVRHGFKLRCGGATAEDFPSVDLVALALRSCRNAQIPVKFTAGLHHPIRNYSDTLFTNQHGFLNIFVAGLLVWAQNPDIETVKNVLNDMTHRRFIFTDESVGWAPTQIDLKTVKSCRNDFITTFGSCSIDEPVQDLRSLGFL
jgi:hypothetical protein